ncbi:MAG TPA: hypothetical protein VEA59_02610 [Patescibacteria group bacterium]|nr:hypothetical protein [Patescibacteria group bacterium]
MRKYFCVVIVLLALAPIVVAKQDGKAQEKPNRTVKFSLPVEKHVKVAESDGKEVIVGFGIKDNRVGAVWGDGGKSPTPFWKVILRWKSGQRDK